jgi:hypothetical protein
MRLGVRESIIGERRVPGDVIVEDGLIAAVGASPAGRRGLAAPGFVDVQVNGFAGADFSTTDLDGYRAAGRAMAASGVTAYQRSASTGCRGSSGCTSKGLSSPRTAAGLTTRPTPDSRRSTGPRRC